ncbi:hypothetical protein VV02_07060 [Luteipulveratus mongoliensis]|uniref:HTH araC/xylS-type domain-containing protein n=2 Tax=Luteipulveratus mongoliensis TaxID=571913 RepID=A0A0K1JQ90_9MICO|nr:hypothetical protein VV02_07060 [Luteipulveratus mongoliensis]
MVGEIDASVLVQRPAEPRWHLVVLDGPGPARVVLAGPKSTSDSFVVPGDVRGTWVQLRLGTYLAGARMSDLVDAELTLAEAGRRTFDLRGSSVEIHEDDDAEAMVEKLVLDGVLAFDPLVGRVLAGTTTSVPERTARHRLRTATGQSREQIRQIERAKHAASLITTGMPLAVVAAEAGYTDQPHLTRSVKRWLGRTPGQLRADA